MYSEKYVQVSPTRDADFFIKDVLKEFKQENVWRAKDQLKHGTTTIPQMDSDVSIVN